MPPKKRKFESTFPAARIKKIMQLDDDVGRVASSVPVVISRAVEIFLQALLTRADAHASSRGAKTLSVGHLKHCIEQEKQWDFLKELTAKIPDVSADVEEPDNPPPSRRGRKRHVSPGGRGKPPASKRKAKGKAVQEKEQEESSDSGTSTPDSSRLAHPSGSSSKSATARSNAEVALPGTTSMDVPGVLGQFGRQVSSGSGPLSISALIAAGRGASNTRQDDSDDDYD